MRAIKVSEEGGKEKKKNRILIKEAGFDQDLGRISLRSLIYSQNVSYIATLFHLVHRVSRFNCAREEAREGGDSELSWNPLAFIRYSLGGKTRRIYANTRAVWCTLCA